MYSLIVTAQEDAWDGKPVVFPRGRFGEYTEDHIRDRFSAFNAEIRSELCAMPAVFAVEGRADTKVHIGEIKDIKVRSREIRLSYEVDREIEDLTWGKLLELAWDLDIRDFESHRTHWAIKEPNLFAELAKAGLVSRSFEDLKAVNLYSKEQVLGAADPLAKDRASAAIDRPLVAVMRPFLSEFDLVYAAVGHVCDDFGFDCLDATEHWEHSAFIDNIFSLIDRAVIVICDLTEQNPNVFYEMGLAHGREKIVIPILQRGYQVPSNISHHRFVTYQSNQEGLDALRRDLAQRLETLSKRLRRE